MPVCLPRGASLNQTKKKDGCSPASFCFIYADMYVRTHARRLARVCVCVYRVYTVCVAACLLWLWPCLVFGRGFVLTHFYYLGERRADDAAVARCRRWPSGRSLYYYCSKQVTVSFNPEVLRCHGWKEDRARELTSSPVGGCGWVGNKALTNKQTHTAPLQAQARQRVHGRARTNMSAAERGKGQIWQTSWIRSSKIAASTC